MNERYTNKDRYEQMSPQELNAEFRQVYAQIPKYENPQFHGDISGISVFYGEEEMGERHRKRQNSEHKKYLAQIHSDLISRSYVSPFFQDIIKGRFGFEYDAGIFLDRPQIPAPHLVFTSRDLLDLDDAWSGGIFDPEKAREIERMSYRAQLSKNAYYLGLSTRQSTQINREILKELEAQMGEEWHNQFLQKHGECP